MKSCLSTILNLLSIKFVISQSHQQNLTKFPHAQASYRDKFFKVNYSNQIFRNDFVCDHYHNFKILAAIIE